MSIQTGFSLVNAAVACAILESISGTLISYNWAQVFEDCDCLKPLSIHFDLCVDAMVLFVISLVFSDLISMP